LIPRSARTRKANGLTAYDRLDEPPGARMRDPDAAPEILGGV